MLRFEDYVEQSRRVSSVAELGQLCATVSRDEGYENCVLTSLRGRRIGRVAWADIPNGYYDAYMQSRWDRIDPVVACSLRAVRPFFWSDVVERTELTEAQIKFMEECRNLKVQSGVVFPFHGPGHQLDIMSLSRRTSELPDKDRLSLLHAISVQTWNRFLELSGEQVFTDLTDASLTAREIEVLRWCKDGKTRPEIGDILSISPKTVEFHLSKIMDKLGATNQITAVVIAIQRGLIEL
jgi:LuxR family transcriptional regulator, quorum-sensing system regulator SolR